MNWQSRFLMHEDPDPPENGEGGGGDSAPPATSERIYAGKYKNPEELEKGYLEESKLAGRARRAFAALEASGYQVDDAGNIFGGPQQYEEPEPVQSPIEDDDIPPAVQAKLAALETEIGMLRQVADVTSRNVIEPERQRLLDAVPEGLREEASAVFARLTKDLKPHARTPDIVAVARRAAIGELLEKHGAWGAPTVPKASDAAADLLEASGGADSAGRDRRGPGRPPGSTLAREVAMRMIETADLKGTDGQPLSVDEYLKRQAQMMRDAAKEAGEED